MHKVLVTVRIFTHISSNPAYDIFKGKGIEVVSNPYKGRGLSEDELIELIPGVHGLLSGVDQVSAKFIQATDELRVISKFGTGVDNIDIDAATEKGIIVTRTPGMNSDSVADMAFALLFAIARRVAHAYEKVKNGEWPLIVGTEIWNKTLGIIGLGEVGRRVALRAKGFNMRVLAYEIAPDEKFVKENNIELVDLNRLLQESDFISIHVPSTKETHHLIGARELSLMKPTSIFINTARGAVVDENALFTALKDKKIQGAGIDVWEKEPTTLNNPLFKLENTVLTPHIASATIESRTKMAELSAKNLVAVLKGEMPLSLVNKDVLKVKPLSQVKRV